ncbi:TetR family transcriptional regulator [Actinomadura rubrobrunea]|uniref:TetR family transcriptional regulator n=1 Tax=Actinomadura rubrobrunea TaxID=115335 RepID=A0A9W6PPL6_9ACTN|nr:TetR/AcrR family transcriptional regulator [Actinomadura rubrobrunea]GLW62309.1 TetR family transcriptional regulator [Actinomadura rubrobrunea]
MAESRRDRLRAATVAEISQIARRILVEQGPQALTLRAIAREMGMTAPALYRYFDSREHLIRYVVGALFQDLTAELTRAIGAAGDLDGKFLAAARAFRRWALKHRREYELLFGAPVPGVGHTEAVDHAEQCAKEFGGTFAALFAELWQERPFRVPSDEEIRPDLREQLRRYGGEMLGDVGLPLGAVLRFLQCWIRLQGGVSLEVFGHLDFALDDPEPMFELMLEEMALILGLKYSPPSGR